MKQMYARGRLEVRRIDAQTRALARATRSPKQQLSELDKRLGDSCGAISERRRLEDKLFVAAGRESDVAAQSSEPKARFKKGVQPNKKNKQK